MKEGTRKELTDFLRFCRSERRRWDRVDAAGGCGRTSGAEGGRSRRDVTVLRTALMGGASVQLQGTRRPRLPGCGSVCAREG
jgi:hypothetical protein